MINSHGAVIVSWDFTHGKDVGILVVGKQNDKGVVDVINAYQGEEAEELYKKLVIRKERK